MKKKMLGLIIGFLLIGVNVFAADGDLIVNGSVGIGTTGLTKRLTVGGGGFQFLAGGHSGVYEMSSSIMDFDTASNQATRLWSIGSGTTKGRFDFHIRDGSGNEMTPFVIDNSGNVGIGTTDPVTKLHIKTGTDQNIKFSAFVNSVNGTALTASNDIASNKNDFEIIANNIIVTPTANVGIGTVSPSYKLDLAGAFRLNSDGGGNSLHISAFNDSVTRIDSTGDINLQREVSLMLGGADNYHNTYIWNGKSSELSIVASFIGSSGNVGIGTTDPGSYKLYVNGTAYSTGGWQSSDIRFKENITSIESPLSKILGIEGISFDWKKDEFKDKGFPEGRHYGVIAQRVERVLPEVVREGPGGEKSVSYTELVPVLIEAMKEQQKTIEKQQKEIGELKAEMNQLKGSIYKNVANLQP